MATNPQTNTTTKPVPLQLPPPTPFGAAMRQHFAFSPHWTNLNQGAYGTYPSALFAVTQHYQQLAESMPDAFVKFMTPSLLPKCREELSRLLHLPREKAEHEIMFMPNATSGVNAVLRGMKWEEGDKILVFDFAYGACGYVVDFVCDTTPAEKVLVKAQLPITEEAFVQKFRDAVDSVKEGKVRLAMFDTIVSMPGYRLPFERMVKECRELGILSLVDGAHGVGQIPLNLTELDADFITSNLHKWLFVPRGCAFLHIPTRNHKLIHATMPISWSHPYLHSSGKPFGTCFDELGTLDNSARLCIPSAIAFREHVCGGEAAIMDYITSVAAAGAKHLAQELGTEVMDTPTGQCALWNVLLPVDPEEIEKEREDVGWWMQEMLAMPERRVGLAVDTEETKGRAWGFQVAYYYGKYWVRVSGQVYLTEEEFYTGLSGVVKRLCEAARRGKHIGHEVKR